MRHILVILAVLALVSCKNEASQNTESLVAQVPQGYESFGNAMDTTNLVSMDKATSQFSSLHTTDTLNIKLAGTVEKVCQMKGCWMTLRLPDNETMMVKFKDYGFFVPKDIDGREVIVRGKAFVEEVSVDDQKHYAKDEGLSDEDIAAISQPKKSISFEADAVLIPVG